jgi:nitroreductase
MGLVKVVRKILSIPENVIPLNVIPIGVPADNEPPIDKWRPENVRWEKW